MKPPGMIIAGGRSRRMGGGDKFLLPLAGRPLIGHVIEQLAGQVSRLAINANLEPSELSGFGLPVLPDLMAAWPGPLAGILVAMAWAGAEGAAQVLTASADTPFLPRDLVERLHKAAGDGVPAIAASAGRIHPVCGLWPVEGRAALVRFLDEDRRLSLTAIVEAQGARIVEFAGEPDPFFNINTPDDFAQAEAIAAGERSG